MRKFASVDSGVDYDAENAKIIAFNALDSRLDDLQNALEIRDSRQTAFELARVQWLIHRKQYKVNPTATNHGLMVADKLALDRVYDDLVDARQTVTDLNREIRRLESI